jgi:hypothetical protein
MLTGSRHEEQPEALVRPCNNLIVNTTASFSSLTGILTRLAFAGLCGR